MEISFSATRRYFGHCFTPFPLFIILLDQCYLRVSYDLRSLLIHPQMTEQSTDSSDCYFTSESCKRLVEVARNNSIVVACDDVYNLLYYGNGSPPHRLFFYDDPIDPNYKGGNVISNGSFSKILSPAIRFGWIECRPRIAKIFRSS